jgi:hypothetical protein
MFSTILSSRVSFFLSPSLLVFILHEVGMGQSTPTSSIYVLFLNGKGLIPVLSQRLVE